MTSRNAGKRLVKSKSGLKMVCQHDRESSPFDMAEPHWTLDDEVQKCPSCNAKFDFIHRRHHCRRCGNIFCGKCCSLKVQFHRMGFVDPVRHCLPCATVTKSEEDFFLNHIKLLFAGAPFHVLSNHSLSTSPSSEDSPLSSRTSSSGGSLSTLYQCKLSSDQRSLLFDPYESESGSIKSGSEDSKPGIPPVDINKVQFTEIHFIPDEDKKGLGSGLTLHVKVPLESDLMTVRLTAPPEPSKKPSVLFILALQKGLNMAIDYRKASHIDDAIEAEETD